MQRLIFVYFFMTCTTVFPDTSLGKCNFIINLMVKSSKAVLNESGTAKEASLVTVMVMQKNNITRSEFIKCRIKYFDPKLRGNTISMDSMTEIENNKQWEKKA